MPVSEVERIHHRYRRRCGCVLWAALAAASGARCLQTATLRTHPGVPVVGNAHVRKTKQDLRPAGKAPFIPARQCPLAMESAIVVGNERVRKTKQDFVPQAKSRSFQPARVHAPLTNCDSGQCSTHSPPSCPDKAVLLSVAFCPPLLPTPLPPYPRFSSEHVPRLHCEGPPCRRRPAPPARAAVSEIKQNRGIGAKSAIADTKTTAVSRLFIRVRCRSSETENAGASSSAGE